MSEDNAAIDENPVQTYADAVQIRCATLSLRLRNLCDADAHTKLIGIRDIRRLRTTTVEEAIRTYEMLSKLRGVIQ